MRDKDVDDGENQLSLKIKWVDGDVNRETDPLLRAQVIKEDTRRVDERERIIVPTGWFKLWGEV